MKTTTRTRTGTRARRGDARRSHNLRRRRRVFPRRRLGRRRRRGRRGFESHRGRNSHHRGRCRVVLAVERAERRGRKRRRDVSVGATRAPRRAGGGAFSVGATRAPAAATPTSTSTRTTPTRATRRTTICSRTIRASRSRRLHPRAIGSRASAPVVRRRRRRRGAWAGGESGGGRGGDTPRRLAARRHRWSATASYATGDFRKRGVGFGNGFGYDADDLGDPSELDRDTQSDTSSTTTRGCPGTAGWCSGTRTTARNLPIRSRARPGTRKNPRTRRVGG